MLAKYENAKILAGGQSLMPMLNMRYAYPDHLIDINRIEDLSFIRTEGDIIAIGSMTRQCEVEFSDIVAKSLPLMSEAIREVGHRQTRNRGTVGGSLCNLDPAAELVCVAVGFDAALIAHGPSGRREIPASEFAVTYMTPSLAADEVLAEIRFAPWSEGHGFAFLEFARRHGDFAVASVAVMIDLDEHAQIRRASLTIGGVSAAPVRLTEGEGKLVGQSSSSPAFEWIQGAVEDLRVLDDTFAPA